MIRHRNKSISWNVSKVAKLLSVVIWIIELPINCQRESQCLVNHTLDHVFLSLWKERWRYRVVKMLDHNARMLSIPGWTRNIPFECYTCLHAEWNFSLAPLRSKDSWCDRKHHFIHLECGNILHIFIMFYIYTFIREMTFIQHGRMNALSRNCQLVR